MSSEEGVVRQRSGGGSSGDGSKEGVSREATGGDQKSQSKEKKRQGIGSRVKGAWTKIGLDWPTGRTMIKGGLAPTIALSIFQASSVAKHYTTLGYLIGIISILSLPMTPRAKFLQTMSYLLVTTCAATGVALLAIFCCVQARLHTTATNRAGTGGAGTSGTPSPGAQTAGYNSSASAVAGIWLFFEIWIINTMRARNPALTIPGIVLCIFANVSMVYAPQFSTMAQGISFATRLLEAFLTGFAIASGVSLFVFPVTMRGVVFKEMTGYVMNLRKVMGANMAYISSLQEKDMFTRTPTGATDKPRQPEAQAIKDALAGLAGLHGKLSVDLTLAKREIAVGKLGPDDLQEIFRRLRQLMIPVTGLSSMVDVFERIAEHNGWDEIVDDRPLDEINDPNERQRAQAVQDWHELSGVLKEPFSRVSKDIDDGFAHVLLALQLVPKPKAKAQDDVEEKSGRAPSPGEDGFTKAMENRVNDFHHKKSHLLKKFADLRGIKLSEAFFENPRTAEFEEPEWYKEKPQYSQTRQRYRRQLFLVLYMDYLFDTIAQSVLDFCKYADEKSQTKLARSRLVVPGYKRFRKWVLSSVSHKSDNYNDESQGMNENGGQSTVYLGDAYHDRKDPEHLPPTNVFQKAGDRLRSIPHFLRSPSSMFGLRVALATLSLAVVAYLHDTQQFYVTQRLFWAQIMITISMTPSAGQSIFSFLLRITGTFAAMVTAFIIYYIVDGKTPGVLVVYWCFVMWGFYIVAKYPKFTPVGMIFSVTNTLIIGYELQVGKLGIQVSESNGQAYYPTYELAPIRLATVLTGLLVAWIWTMFPWPISEHSELRRDLGASLYLLANYYSVVDETVRIRVSGEALPSHLSTEESPMQKLDKARLKVFSKSVLLLQALRTHADFVSFDIPIGGRFPRATYQKIIARVQSILNFSTMISYSSKTFAEMWEKYAEEGEHTDASESKWLKDFRRLNKEVGATSKEVTTLLSLLSASVAAGQPLPPYIKAPEGYALSSKLDEMDKDILSVRHLIEPGYAAFACMQIATKCIEDDLRALLRDIKSLVGELNFSFHVVSTVDSSETSSLVDDQGSNGKSKAA